MNGTSFALVWGPKDVSGKSQGMHMYFATYKAYYEGIYWRREQGQDPVYPEPLPVPFGAVLSFDQMDIRFHSEHSAGCTGSGDPDRNRFVFYAERNGEAGLLLPKLTRTLQYGTVEEKVTETLPEIFLPFPPYGGDMRVKGGYGRIVSCLTPVATTEQLTPSD